jgi:hypothetical protein
MKFGKDALEKALIFKLVLIISILSLVSCEYDIPQENLKVKTDFEAIKTILMAYEAKSNRLATNREDIDDLLDGVYSADPWGNPYLVGYLGNRKYVMISSGRDRIFGSQDDQSAIVTW